MHSDRQPAPQTATRLENIQQVSCSISQVTVDQGRCLGTPTENLGQDHQYIFMCNTKRVSLVKLYCEIIDIEPHISTNRPHPHDPNSLCGRRTHKTQHT